jgi:hypothetical protein
LIASKLRSLPAGLGAIAALVVAWALLMHGIGWAQTANLAQVRALDRGQAQIDPWHWETKDKAWVDGHFYSVKAPGLSLLTAPVYWAFDHAGGWNAADRAASEVHSSDSHHWDSHPVAPYSETGFDRQIAEDVAAAGQREVPAVWLLAIFGAVIPALIMLLVVRSLGDRFERGFGSIAAVTLGVGTIVMSFASEYFSHVAAATLGIAAFALLFRERSRPDGADAGVPRAAVAAGLCCGLAVTFEYPLGLVGVVLFAYLVSAPRRRFARAAAYAGGAFLGALPVLLFNQWAFGSPLEFAYSNAVAIQGTTGHVVLGLNSDGFFGITAPKGAAAVDLLFASRGLLVLTPVIAMGIAGAIALRRSFRAEANVILAVCAVYFAYNTGYWLPFGGGTPGPRFLIPALPFLALGLAVAWKRWPALTLATAVPSTVFMVGAALTKPLIGDEGTWTWAHMLFNGDFEATPLSALGLHTGWIAILPVAFALVAVVVLAGRSLPSLRLGEVRWALVALAGWTAVAVAGPTISGDPVTPTDGGGEVLQLIALAVVMTAATLGVLRFRELRTAPASAPAQPPLAAPPEAAGTGVGVAALSESPRS